MKPLDFLRRAVDPNLKILAALTDIAVTDKARIMLMATAGQESNWAARRQHGGPARSYWQFEQFGGVAELFTVTPLQVQAVCGYLDIPYSLNTVYEAMAWNDTLGCAMARLLLWQDPAFLPEVGAYEVAWEYYVRNWRPGAPRPDDWPGVYATSLLLVQDNPIV
jgi:hypothetical protein